MVILAGRRLLVPRVRATTSPVDYLALILLLVIIVTGIVPTLFVNLFGHGYDYRTTVALWCRGLFSGSPDFAAIASAPVVYQVHAASAWLIWVAVAAWVLVAAAFLARLLRHPHNPAPGSPAMVPPRARGPCPTSGTRRSAG